MRFWTDTKLQAITTLVIIIAFAIVGLIIGTPPNETGSITTALKTFLQATETRLILVLILIDVITGVIAAIRVNTFDGQRIADFMFSNVLPYVLGYATFWLVSYYGLSTLLPAVIVDGLAAAGYGAVMSALTLSIADNFTRIKVGHSKPEFEPASAVAPSEGQG